MTNLSQINKDIEKSNIEVSNYTINMTLEYSALNDLQLEDMSPASWWDFVKRMAKSPNGACNKVI